MPPSGMALGLVGSFARAEGGPRSDLALAAARTALAPSPATLDDIGAHVFRARELGEEGIPMRWDEGALRTFLALLDAGEGLVPTWFALGRPEGVDHVAGEPGHLAHGDVLAPPRLLRTPTAEEGRACVRLSPVVSALATTGKGQGCSPTSPIV